MGFNSVYRVLQEVFPQVDSRALKAVAIEHSKDADVAVEVVLVEIIPHLPEALDTSFSAQVNSDTIVEPVNLESLATSYHGANGETMTGYSSKFLETTEDNNSNIHDSGSSDNHGQGCENVDNETFNVSVSNQLIRSCETNLDATRKSNSSSLKSVFEKDAFAVEFVDSDDEPDMSPLFTRSEAKCNTEFLEEIIEEAKNNKKTLMEAMSSVVDLMREVESKEKDADQAKAEATQDCSDILAKVDEVKQALLRAKEANDMHGGEVNAEKAILATELKELQLRLFGLSDERNRSLGILDEMRQALEIRLAAALDEIAAAKEQKIENERAAREALSYQESQMEKVVEESKKLKLEADENSKLQEFLMDRGRAIDILQGEISVKCQDVLLLKEKFDKGISLSGSFSSSRTSSILASSSSSFRSVVTPFVPVPEPEPEFETYENLMKSANMGDSFGFLDKSLRSDVAPQSPKFLEESVNPIDDHKLFLEDEWEIMEK